MAGGGNNVTKMSPRQRMINLMYIVLTAMLALNVSSDVLNGFSQVHAGLTRTNRTMTAKNELEYELLRQLNEKKPEKAGKWYRQGQELKVITNQLYSMIDSLKVEIAHATDGVNGDYNNLINKDNLEAAGVVMLNPSTKGGARLRQRIDKFREYVAAIIPDPNRRAVIVEMLSTIVNKKGPNGPISWEEQNFENMPAIASVTLLTKLQTDIRQAEAEALNQLISNVDTGEIRPMRLQPQNAYGFSAHVLPRSTMIMRGGRYSAEIVLAAIDSVNKPAIYVGGSRLSGNVYEFTASGVGTHQYSGYIEAPNSSGVMQRYPFSSSYTVVEPMATISPTMMNVLYAGIDNPISISVPGVPMSSIQASMSNGTLTRNGDTWVARTAQVGSEAVITVSASIDGHNQTVGSMTFRVRKLPDPSPYIALSGADGAVSHYKGMPKRISKASLLRANGLSAAIDDDILNVKYSVLSFTMVFFDSMGNAMPENSSGASFSARQVEKIRQLKPGKTFFISNVKATGPDGVTRDIAPMEVGLSN